MLDPGALPNLVVIGAAKCGTSALHYYLDLHPQCSMSHPKELNFFISTVDYRGLSPESAAIAPANKGTWARGIDWYERHFDSAAPVRGESSPAYFAPWHPGVPERMATVIPDARLVLCVRDPVERAISHYGMTTLTGRESRPIEVALTDRSSAYLELGRYATLLGRFLEHFPASRVMVIDQAELMHRRRETVRDVFRFAGLESSFWSPRMERERNRSGGRRRELLSKVLRLRIVQPAYRLPEQLKWVVERAATGDASTPELDPDLRGDLCDLFRGEADALRELSGKAFASWSV
jgi:Sulfotransferase family